MTCICRICGEEHDDDEYFEDGVCIYCIDNMNFNYFHGGKLFRDEDD
jgi:hypothetical protein